MMCEHTCTPRFWSKGKILLLFRLSEEQQLTKISKMIINTAVFRLNITAGSQ